MHGSPVPSIIASSADDPVSYTWRSACDPENEFDPLTVPLLHNGSSKHTLFSAQHIPVSCTYTILIFGLNFGKYPTCARAGHPDRRRRNCQALGSANTDCLQSAGRVKTSSLVPRLSCAKILILFFLVNGNKSW